MGKGKKPLLTWKIGMNCRDAEVFVADEIDKVEQQLASKRVSATSAGNIYLMGEGPILCARFLGSSPVRESR